METIKETSLDKPAQNRAMSLLISFASSSACMMSLSLVVALLTNWTQTFPETALPPSARKALTIGLLATMLTLSLSRVPAQNLKPDYRPGALLRGLLMGLIIPSVIPILGFFILKDTAYAGYAAGLVFIAAAPFAASVAPLSFILCGDMQHAARSTIYVYLAALVWIPLVVYSCLGAWVDMEELFKIVITIIGMPLVLSRLFVRFAIDQKKMAIFMNCTIFCLVWLSVSTTDFRSAGAGVLVFFLFIVAFRTFGLGLLVDALDRKIGVGWSERVMDILMASYKNKGVAIALCVTTMGIHADSAMVAIATSILLEICWVIYMDSVLFSRKRMKIALAGESKAGGK